MHMRVWKILEDRFKQLAVSRGKRNGFSVHLGVLERRDEFERHVEIFAIDRRDRKAYISEEVLPGVRMVRDSDNDKMFLVKGARKCALIDSGMGRGALKEYMSQFAAGMPIEVIFTHNHGDHIGQADEFIRDSTEHIGAADLPGHP